MKTPKLDLIPFLFSLCFSLNTFANISVPATKVTLKTRDGKPAECGQFTRVVSKEVFGVYGEHFSVKFQSQVVDETFDYTDATGTVVFPAKNVETHFGLKLTKNPRVSIYFRNLGPRIDGKCDHKLGIKFAVDHYAKNLDQTWSRYKNGCSIGATDTGNIKRNLGSLECQLIFNSAQLAEMTSIVTSSLNDEWTTETQQLEKELFEKPVDQRDNALITSLLKNKNTNVNARCTYKYCHGYSNFNTLFSAFLYNFRAKEAQDYVWIENFMEAGADLNAKDASLKTPLFTALQSRGTPLDTLNALEPFLKASHWTQTDSLGETPFFTIAAGSNVGLLEHLLAKAEVLETLNQKDTYDLTPLGFYKFIHNNPGGESEEDIKVLDLLLKAGAN